MPLIVALMAMLLMVSLGSALTLLAVSEMLVSGSYRAGSEALHAADAALELAVADLATAGDWNSVLAGVARSAAVDGDPGVRDTAAGRLNLPEMTSIERCGRRTACSDADVAIASQVRPWGANNPVWQLYAYGPLRDLLSVDSDGVDTEIVDSDMYVVVWVGDDPAECDGRPDVDGGRCEDGPNAGAGVVAVLAHAYGPAGVRRAIEATVSRGVDARLRLLSWREVR